MKSKLALILTLSATTMFTQVAVTQSYTLLHSFSGPDGGSPSGLIQTADDTFYGAADLGGDVTPCDPDGCGTLFKIDRAGHFTVLHVFHATDVLAGKTKRAFTIKPLNVGAAQTFHVYAYTAGQGVRTTLTALP